MSLPGFYIDDLHIPVPIIQGGMGVGISLSGLAAAVASQGGVGVISAAMIGFKEPDVRTNHTEANLRALRREIRRARELSSGVIGVNILASLTDFEVMASCAMDEGVDLIISGGGLPRTLPGLVKPGQKTKLIPVVSSGRAAELLARMWVTRYNRVPDAFVVEGPLAGGHLGFKRSALDAPESRLDVLVKDVVEVAKKLKETHGRDVPVIAAGGIYSHQDILDMLAIGASGVQLGTRFVATHECDADLRFKQAYVDSTQDDIVIIDSPLGLPGRAIVSPFLNNVTAGNTSPTSCYSKCMASCGVENAPYCISLALISAQRGNFRAGFAFCGANAWKVDRIVSVAELMHELTTGETGGETAGGQASTEPADG